MLGAVSHPPRPPLLISGCRPNAAPFCVLQRRPLLRAFSTIPRLNSFHSPLIPKASVGSSEYVVETGTNVKFPRELRVPGCSGSLVLLGTGYREKVFAIIGVKVYAAGFYVEPSIRERLDAWKGKPATEVLGDCSLFSLILQAPLEKSLNIMLVRDVDGKTFWNALDDVISPRIKNPTSVDESALLTFRSTFQSRDLKQGTFIFLTWVVPSKMLISISSGGFPSNVDAEIESANVNMALYDAFFGESPVSPTLKTSVVNGLTEVFS
ncbi:fatty-acid-binding protein 3, chloroplastic [Elaeis guineensis]|uniref:Chalcone-flavonone isomerase family protein n=1 Tax=Elaeis guineensis var. tenera TaxID=51953 RepID=A0A6I9QW61_ELAGV|nr:fatty-acid-binding protein 3, chloroplastic [Elaeis guineensis]XP_010916105.1 fatty-acid-binding protein 3, chloroplastic [Elaeis guineensis]XP_010916107.1 fatty-acid-binding protein 3, chloroplastic [Elaeis guineensis]XP_010916108.1 fatty-acid-binding protein 3, chloroplastic [Elaeis guineensis]XP_029119186.1 fatty-acid-binding protein 3, chloroplastic [Elaeis guineensis]